MEICIWAHLDGKHILALNCTHHIKSFFHSAFFFLSFQYKFTASFFTLKSAPSPGFNTHFCPWSCRWAGGYYRGAGGQVCVFYPSPINLRDKLEKRLLLRLGVKSFKHESTNTAHSVSVKGMKWKSWHEAAKHLIQTHVPFFIPQICPLSRGRWREMRVCGSICSGWFPLCVGLIQLCCSHNRFVASVGEKHVIWQLFLEMAKFQGDEKWETSMNYQLFQ